MNIRMNARKAKKTGGIALGVLGTLLVVTACEQDVPHDTGGSRRLDVVITVGEDYPSLVSAMSYVNGTIARDGSRFTIVITKDEDVPPLDIRGLNGKRTVVIKRNTAAAAPTESGAAYSLSEAAPYTLRLGARGSLFTVDPEAELEIKEGIILEGRETNIAPLVSVQGRFTLGDGAEIKGNGNNGAQSRGGGVYVAGAGEAVIEGTVTGCFAELGGGVYAAGTCVFAGSALTWDNVSVKGRGVYVDGVVKIKDSAVIRETTGLYVAGEKTVIIEGTLSPGANTQGGTAKAFDMVVENPEQHAAFLEDEAGNGGVLSIVSTDNRPMVPSALGKPPVLEGGMEKLYVSWKAAALATSYEVYYGTANNPAEVIQLPDTTELSVEIQGVAPGAGYYAWVRTKNAAGASAVFTASNYDETGDPIPEGMWGPCESAVGDNYVLIQEDHALGYGLSDNLEEAYGAGYSFGGPIVYHKVFTRNETITGVGTSTGDSGIIIIKFVGPKYNNVPSDCDYYGIYYWGWGDISSHSDYMGWNILYMANAWPIYINGGHPDGRKSPAMHTPTLRAAKDLYTLENRDVYVGWGIVYPQYHNPNP